MNPKTMTSIRRSLFAAAAIIALAACSKSDTTGAARPAAPATVATFQVKPLKNTFYIGEPLSLQVRYANGTSQPWHVASGTIGYGTWKISLQDDTGKIYRGTYAGSQREGSATRLLPAGQTFDGAVVLTYMRFRAGDQNAVTTTQANWNQLATMPLDDIPHAQESAPLDVPTMALEPVPAGTYTLHVEVSPAGDTSIAASDVTLKIAGEETAASRLETTRAFVQAAREALQRDAAATKRDFSRQGVASTDAALEEIGKGLKFLAENPTENAVQGKYFGRVTFSPTSVPDAAQTAGSDPRLVAAMDTLNAALEGYMILARPTDPCTAPGGAWLTRIRTMKGIREALTADIRESLDHTLYAFSEKHPK